MKGLGLILFIAALVCCVSCADEKAPNGYIFGRHLQIDATGFDATPRPFSLPEENSRIINMCGGLEYAVAISELGKVYMWGDGASDMIDVPIRKVLPDSSSPAVNCSCMKDSAIVLTADGKVYGWGNNAQGQMCMADTTFKEEFVRITALDAYATIVSMDGGTAHAVFVTSDGKVLACGSNAQGELCQDPATLPSTSTPIVITLPEGVSALKVDLLKTATLVLTDEATNNVYGCGLNVNGQLGINSTVSPITSPTRIVGDVGRIVSFSGRANSVLLLNDEAKVFGVGSNSVGQLGLPDYASYPVPTRVDSLSSHVVYKISGGANHGVVLTSSGHVLTFGDNAYGQLGVLTPAKSNAPVAIDNSKIDKRDEIQDIDCGLYHTMLIVLRDYQDEPSAAVTYVISWALVLVASLLFY